jgi:hypothetical protein
VSASEYKVASSDIRTASGVLAYTRGQKVHVDAVKNNGWEDYVVGEDTDKAREIRAEFFPEYADEAKQTRSTRAAASSTSSDVKE